MKFQSLLLINSVSQTMENDFTSK